MNANLKFTSATATKADTGEAMRDIIIDIHAKLASPPDLVLVFLSAHHVARAVDVLNGLQEALRPGALMGCTGEGVIGSEEEIERSPAIAVIACQLPGTRVSSFALRAAELHEASGAEKLVKRAPIDDDTRLVLLLADPFSVPMDAVLEAFNATHAGLPVIGGMASGGSFPGGNAMMSDKEVLTDGVVAVALSGAIDADVIVSQGCRPVGPAFRVTQAENNVIEELDGRPPLVCLQSVVSSMSDDDRALLKNGLFIGRAVDAKKETHGRGDFLVRGVMSINQQTGAITIGDYVRTGQVVQFHLRDAQTAKEDLEMLLTPHSLFGRPSGAFLFSCNGRGTRLYDHANGDISALQQFFPGIHAAGFFCAGEIGPIAGRNFLHGHTASLALIRRPGNHSGDAS